MSSTKKLNKKEQENKIIILSFKADYYEIRTEMHQGKKHIVIPVVMLVEGVHHGSAGQLLHLEEEFGKICGSWDGIPVSIMHPEIDGQYVSANQPEVIDSQTVGRIYNTMLDDGKLKAEAWIDEEKLSQISPAALSDILQRKPLEVSTGVFTDDDFTAGEWEGEEYIAVARNHKPDHLALLPGGIGACSWDDGCGIRANKDEGGEQNLSTKDKDSKKSETPEILEKAEKKETTFSVDIALKKKLSFAGYSIQSNEQGFKEVGKKIQSKLDAMDDDVNIHFLEEVWDNRFVYKVESRGDVKFLKRNYAINVDESIEFTGEPVAVVMVKEFKILQENNKKGGIETMSDENKEVQPCCPEQVKTIIQSNATRFEESDREFLESLDSEKIIKLLPVEVEPIIEPQVNKEQAVVVLKEAWKEMSTPEQFLELLPQNLQDQFKHGQNLYDVQRNEMIAGITINTDAFTTDELKVKDFEELQKLSKAITPKVDFTVLGSGGDSHVEVVQPLGSTGMSSKTTN